MWPVDVRYSSSLLVLCLSLSTPLVASEAVSESRWREGVDLCSRQQRGVHSRREGARVSVYRHRR